MKERLKLHNLRIDYVVIQSELKNLIGARNVDFEERVLCGNPLQLFSSGLESDPEPTQKSGPIANTSVSGASTLCSLLCLAIDYRIGQSDA